MTEDLLSVISFVLITTFTPGPNNITSAAMGVLHGYRKTFNFLLGISIGFFFMMLVSAWASASILAYFPFMEPVLRYVGAGYIIYLAYGTFQASYNFDEGNVKPMGFIKGMLLQLLNPKLIVYGLTLFSTFLASITDQPGPLLIAVILLTFTSFTSISVWTLFGTAIKTYLHHPRVKLGVNALLSLFLVYSALNLAGLI
ncbi:MAG: lysine transporter LysE [Chloroflexi bacterium]|nr:MAG: lysine transporter LysE [Chloroflexota bacterium]MBL1194132.1 lysine transporter LysE [Chloroflexota bacterium]NOH11425.1 LysE family transporter [Chloroflexota bacterium]